MGTNTRMKLEALPDPFRYDGDGMVHTSSHLRMWRLTKMRGYLVVGSGLLPRSTVLGRTRYTRVWDLVPPRGT